MRRDSVVTNRSWIEINQKLSRSLLPPPKKSSDQPYRYQAGLGLVYFQLLIACDQRLFNRLPASRPSTLVRNWHNSIDSLWPY